MPTEWFEYVGVCTLKRLMFKYCLHHCEGGQYVCFKLHLLTKKGCYVPGETTVEDY